MPLKDPAIAAGAGALKVLPDALRELGGSKPVVISDTIVSRLYAPRILRFLKENKQEANLIEIPSGESSKSFRNAEFLFGRLAECKAGRTTPILALGGGVTTDLAGFVASTYMRGLPLVLIPTTLLAQVDAGIGGKTGINLKWGKNLVGTFYPAHFTLIDFDFLKTLPPREIRNGFAEIVKMCVLGGEKVFGNLERLAENRMSFPRTRESSFNIEDKFFQSLLEYSIKAKLAVVKKDPKEMSGRRAILNLGHTFAHGLEAAAGYKAYTHGEAVAIGLVGACLLAESVAGTSSTLTERVESVLVKCGLPVRYKKIIPEKILAHMAHDKKQVHTLRFVLPLKLGKVELRENIPEYMILSVLERLKT